MVELLMPRRYLSSDSLAGRDVDVPDWVNAIAALPRAAIAFGFLILLAH